MDTKDILKPRRRLLFVDGSEKPYPDSLIGDWEGIKGILGFEMGQIVPIEGYGPEGDWVMVLDEDGKVKGEPAIVNLEATRLWLRLNVSVDMLRYILRINPGLDVIVGNVAIVRYDDLKDPPEEDNDD